ncbi:hypothetical protein [Tessaracoccus sp. OH4464_COT-324]|uniref:hypothetical protein n=1 Tax=Tessaracoccus sp. OH4464_COT-324 TaxID=2491059 RepID=UPI001319D380|nr:hypothetical protein [Tessaracoccus sp. OH4464_COT-324]
MVGQRGRRGSPATWAEPVRDARPARGVPDDCTLLDAQPPTEQSPRGWAPQQRVG